MISSAEKDRIRKISLLTALSCVLQISESLIPHPIPGLRLGLANMITLIALVILDFRSAMEISVFRTILSSLIMGTFMSPTFILSISGALTSTLVMGLLFRITGGYRLSLIGISIVGAMVHNMVQLYLAYLILVRHPGIFVFFPWLAIGSVATGWITGAVAGGVCEKLDEMKQQPESLQFVRKPVSDPLFDNYFEGSSVLHRLSSEFKITALFVIAIADLVFSSFPFYSGLFPFLALLMILSQIPAALFVGKIKKYSSLLLIAFLLPLFFNSGTHHISVFGFIHYTQEGLEAGALCAFRIFFLIWASSLIIMTTSPAEMSRGLGNILSPVRFFGFSEKRMAAIMTTSCETIPLIWQTSRETIRAADFAKAKNLKNLIPVLCGLIATLYLTAEPGEFEVRNEK